MERKNFIGGSGHLNFHFLSEDPQFDPTYFTWAFVRHPYTRIASAYFYAKQRHVHDLERWWPDPTWNIEDFVMNLETCLPEYYDDSMAEMNATDFQPHIYSQGYYLDSYEFKIDFIGRYESIKSDWRKACARISIKAGVPRIQETLDHRNKTTGVTKDYEILYTKEMKEEIYRIYRKDFLDLKYEK